MIELKVLGTGCAKCSKLYQLAQEGISRAALEATLSKVEEIDEILSYGVMMTPALLINGELKSSGRLPKVQEIEAWIKAAL